MIGKIKENKMLKIVIFVLLDLVLAFVLTLPIVNGVKNEKIELKDGSFVNNSNSNPFTLDKGIYRVNIQYDTTATEAKSKINFIDPDNNKVNDVEASLMPAYSKNLSYRVYVDSDEQKAEIKNEGTNPQTHIKSAEVVFQKGLTRSYYMTKYAFYILLIGFIIWFIIKGRKKFVQYKNKNIVLGILLTIGVLIIPILTNTIMSGHDMQFHLFRMVGIDEGFKMGQFPIRMQPNWENGYGVALGVTYPNIPLVPSAVLWGLGFPILVAYKWHLVLAAILMVVLSYFAFEKICKNKNTALFGSIAYSLSTYHLTNMFTRQALGENFAMIFFPLIILGFYELLRKEKPRENFSFYLLIGMTGVVVSHPLSVLIVAIFSVIICLIMITRVLRKQTILALLKTAVFTILVNLWVIVPMMDYYINEALGVNNNDIYKLNETGVSLKDLVFGSGNADSRTTGVALLIVLFLAIFLLFNDKKTEVKRKFMSLLVAISILSIFMASEFFPYTWIKTHMKGVYDFLSRLQFPMRFLGVASATLATLFVLILVVKKANKKFYYATIIIVLGFSLIQTWSFNTKDMTFKNYTDVSQIDSFGDTKNYTLDGSNKEAKHSQDIENTNFELQVNIKNRKGTTFVLELNNKGPKGEIVLPVTGYKDYVAEYDGGSLETKKSNLSKLSVVIPENFNKEVKVYYKEPIVWRVAEIISLLSIVYLIFYLSKLMIDKRKKEKAEEKDDQQISEQN